MYRLNANTLQEIAAMSGRRIVTPDDPEPDWLREAVERERILPLLRADRRAARASAGDRRGIVALVRLALGRA